MNHRLLAKKNKRENIYRVILSLLLSVQTVCMTRVNFKGLQKMVDVNYMDSFGVSAIILGIILYIFFYVIICVIDEPIKKFIGKHSVVTHVEDKDRKRILGFWAIIIFITWIPYYLSYYPGGIYIFQTVYCDALDEAFY